ncbi:hypothetical protein LSM04_005364 [Trypanosoma melophagium]|uniref:uncharacterized protein n=1 Tax=Trypanosoma melophagium TaxID=715481 RepID=UPI00351A3D28|nr:hypothetical protein LSM04_005364 [Trypanosoma melophagium]
MNVYQNIDCTPKNKVICLELGENEDSDLLYIPVVFSRQLHKFASPSSQQLKNSGHEHDMKHLYPGSIVLTRTNIFLTLSLLPADIHSHDYCSCEFRDNDKTAK